MNQESLWQIVSLRHKQTIQNR